MANQNTLGHSGSHAMMIHCNPIHRAPTQMIQEKFFLVEKCVDLEIQQQVQLFINADVSIM